jgi:hypothetical protein
VVTAVWRMLECSSSTAFSDRYSLTKPSPTDKQTIARMMPASARSPTTTETIAAPANRMRSGFLSCRQST